MSSELTLKQLSRIEQPNFIEIEWSDESDVDVDDGVFGHIHDLLKQPFVIPEESFKAIEHLDIDCNLDTNPYIYRAACYDIARTTPIKFFQDLWKESYAISHKLWSELGSPGTFPNEKTERIQRFVFICRVQQCGFVTRSPIQYAKEYLSGEVSELVEADYSNIYRKRYPLIADFGYACLIIFTIMGVTSFIQSLFGKRDT